MGAVTLTELRNAKEAGLADPFTTEKWRILSLPSMGGITLNPIACEEIDLPFPTFTEKSKEIASTQIHWPHATSVDGFGSMWGLDQKLTLMKYFQNWAALIQNPYTGGFSLPSAYKKRIQIALFDIKGEIIARSEVRNCWPVGMQPLALNGTGTRGTISVQWKCDVQRLIF